MGLKIKAMGAAGLYLSPWSKNSSVTASGLYLKTPSGGFVKGSGLILGPNSPLKNIPLLGWALQFKYYKK